LGKKFSCRQKITLAAAGATATGAGAAGAAEEHKNQTVPAQEEHYFDALAYCPQGPEDYGNGLDDDYWAERMRDAAAKELTQKCPVCGRLVRPDDRSEMLEAVCNSWESIEKGRDALLVAHVRHEHTDYEKQMELEDEDWEAEDFDPYEKREQIKREANRQARELIAKKEADTVNATVARLEGIARNSQAEGKLMAEAALAHFRKASTGMSREQVGQVKKALKKKQDEEFLKGIMGLISGFGAAGLDVGKKGRRRK